MKRYTKIISCACSAALMVGMLPFGAAAATNNGTSLAFDVNNDNVLNVLDITSMQKYIAELESYDADQIEKADINGDGEVAIDDVYILQNALIDKTSARVSADPAAVSVSFNFYDDAGTPMMWTSFMLKDSDGQKVDEWVSPKEDYTIAGLNAKEKYTLEIVGGFKALGYYRKVDSVTFTAGEQNKIYLTAERTKTIINVKDETSGKNLTGAEIKLNATSGGLVDETVFTTVPYIYRGLSDGISYTISSTKAPEGYVYSHTEVISDYNNNTPKNRDSYQDGEFVVGGTQKDKNNNYGENIVTEITMYYTPVK